MFSKYSTPELTNSTVDSVDSTPSEFQRSAIPDWYAKIAFDTESTPDELAETLRGDFEWTGRSGSSQRIEVMTRWDAKRYYYWDKYTKDGGWVANQAELTGLEDNPAYLKLYSPRTDYKTGKIVKYETPAKSEARPLLPPFTWEMGLKAIEVCPKRVQLAYRERLEASEAALTDVDWGFWDFVEAHPEVPIVLTEGWKKGCALAVRGYPTVVLRGVRCFFKGKAHKFDIPSPHAVNDRLFLKGRKVTFAFDQDEKESTKKDVAKALGTIAYWLEKRKCKVAVAKWDNHLGKGVDDALFGLGDGADEWLEGVISDAEPFRLWKREDIGSRKLEIINALNTLSYPPERATQGEYLPQLPTLSPGAIHVLSATMNSGKTVRIGADWVKSAVAAGWRVLVLSPLNSLGQQTAQNWDLPHIHDYAPDKDSQKALWADVSSRRGIVMCFDSLHRLPQWFFERNNEPCPILLILDEANQGISHLTYGATLGNRWADIRAKFSAIATHCSKFGAIVLSEDGLPDRAISFIKRIAAAGTDTPVPVRAITHKKLLTPWDCTFWGGGNPSGFRADLLAAIATQKKAILFVTTSKAEGRRLEKSVGRRFPCKKVSRIDSDTNQKGEFREFFADPSEWLRAETPDLVILTPSGRTGLSIEGGVSPEDAYFESVWGYFSALDTDSMLQLLGRYRPAVPRNIYCPKFIQTSSDEATRNSWAIKARWQENAKGLARMLENAEAADKTYRELEIEDATLDYLAKSIAVAGAQKAIAQYALIERLKGAGHIISVIPSNHSKEVAAEWKTIQIEIDWEDARLAASLQIDPTRETREWAIETLSSNDVAIEVRMTAQKVLWRDEFPGVDFDSPEECYEAIYRDYGRMRRGIRLQAQTENPAQTKLMDAGKLKVAIKQGKLHDLPKDAMKAVTLNALGVLDLLDGESYSNEDPRAVTVKEKALEYKGFVRYWLNLCINENQSPVEICHKLLRRFGFEIDKDDRPGAIEMVGRPGKRNEARDRVYRVNADFSPIRTRLLEAYRRKLSELIVTPVSMISTTPNTYIEIVDTKAEIPIDEGLEGGRTEVETAAYYLEEGVRAEMMDVHWMKSLTQHLTPTQKQQVWARLTPEIREQLKAIAA